MTRPMLGCGLILLVLAYSGAVWSQPQQAVELRCARPDISRLKMEDGGLYDPQFLGDVNGDEYDDFIVSYPSRGEHPSDALLS